MTTILTKHSPSAQKTPRSTKLNDGDLPFNHLKERKDHQKARAGFANLAVRNAEGKVTSLARTVGQVAAGACGEVDGVGGEAEQ